MIVYISDPNNSTKELLQLINTYSNGAGYRINSKKVSSPPIYMIKKLRKKSEKHHLSQ